MFMTSVSLKAMLYENRYYSSLTFNYVKYYSGKLIYEQMDKNKYETIEKPVCPYCNSELSDESRCPGCGARIR